MVRAHHPGGTARCVMLSWEERSVLIIGIDPGKKGGVVTLDVSGRPTAVEWTAADHPEDGYVAGKAYNVRSMVRALEEVSRRGEVALVVLERQQARPIEGRTSCLTTGYGWGLWSGIVHALGLPLIEVSSARWTRHVFVGVQGEGKARSIAAVGARLPELALTWGRRRKPHDGLADAGCLALYGLSQLGPLM
jgi:crossover junction endodeoxyribonuclease RuvC